MPTEVLARSAPSETARRTSRSVMMPGWPSSVWMIAAPTFRSYILRAVSSGLLSGCSDQGEIEADAAEGTKRPHRGHEAPGDGPEHGGWVVGLVDDEDRGTEIVRARAGRVARARATTMQSQTPDSGEGLPEHRRVDH